MNKIGNFDIEMTHTSFMSEGYFYDNYFNNGDDMMTENGISLKYAKARIDCSTKVDSKQRYEFAFIPNNGFLTSPELLMKYWVHKVSNNSFRIISIRII